MKTIRLLVLSLLLTLLAWSIIAWPIPRHVASGIPLSWRNTEQHETRTMVAGDHLQFLYHLWLAKDTFFGPTPLFHNLYEFNQGSDADRKDITTRYYLPFSLIFSLGAARGNLAFAWNFTGFITLWLTLCATWVLVRRYTSNRLVTVMAAFLSIIFPYRWFTLMGGSPTGLAMTWVPIIYLGLDIMIKEKNPWGGALAGLAITLAEWCDPHVTFFTGLTAPFWCILSYIYHHQRYWPTKREFLRMVRAALPLVLFGIMVLLQAWIVKARLDTTSIAGKSRPLSEVALSSPSLSGIVNLKHHGVNSQIYIGFLLLGTLALSLLATVRDWLSRRSEAPRKTIHLCCSILLGLALIAIIILSTGTRNPGGSRAWSLLTRIIPPYGKIRQAGKIFTLMPTLTALFIALTLPALLSIWRRRSIQITVGVILMALLVADYGSMITPQVCILDKEQGAYHAVVKDAAHEGNTTPRVICLPLWPGDSHWTSLNEYYVSLYRIRMLNGYRPTPSIEYKNYISQFESFNKGTYDDSQLDELLRKEISYVILQEDAFPEKVSPFSVSHTLHGLLASPRLKLIAKDGATWTFKIVAAPEGVYPDLPDWKLHLPARLWQAERAISTNAIVLSSPDTSGNRYLQLPNSQSYALSQPYPLSSLSGMCFLVRLKGSTRAKATVVINNEDQPSTEIEPAEEWTWHRVAVPEFEGYNPVQLRIEPTDGPVDIDLTILATEEWDPNTFDTPITIPAALFFHSGYIDIQTGNVILQPYRDAAAAIFYGPKLPVPAGSYNIQLEYESSAPDGTVLGTLRSRYPYGKAKPTEIVAGKPAMLKYRQDVNLRLAIDFVYSRNAEIRIKNMIISPVTIADNKTND